MASIPYRKFKLVNGNGTEFPLANPSKKVFGNNPQGLGYTKTLNILRLGDDNFIPYQIFNLDPINFEILFYDDTLSDKYQKYNDFISFLSFKPLYLLYQKPNSFTWYRRAIETMSLTKTEVSYQDRMMHCQMQVQTLGFWEDNDVNVIETSQLLESGKVYPITYPFSYGSSSLSGIALKSIGMLESPLQITINGTVSNPQYILYDSNDNVYGRGKFNGTFDKVYINPDEANEELTLERNGAVLDNPLSYQDLTVGSPYEIYVTFLKLKTGDSKIRFIVDGGFSGSVRLEWRNRYVSV